MSPQDCRPAGTPWISPYLTVRNAEAAIDFYQRAFGFKKKDAMLGPDGKVMHAEMSYQDCLIMMSPENAYGGPCKAPATSKQLPPITLYVYCEDVEALCAQARDAGAKVLAAPQDMFWGDRMCRLEDPDGYIWAFATKVGEFDPNKMPKM